LQQNVLSVKKRSERAVIALALCFAVVALALVAPMTHAQQTPLVNVRVFPDYPITANDSIHIQANVTTYGIAVRNVTIFYYLGPSGLQFSSKSDYNHDFMYQTIWNPMWGLWQYQFDRQPANTSLYFFVEATNVIGQTGFWPGNVPEASRPWIVSVVSPDKSYLYSLSVTINDLDLGAKLQRANVTVEVGAYAPTFPERYWDQATVQSGGYFAFWMPMFEQQSSRFDYRGKASGWADLSNGRLQDVPFDQYDLYIAIRIPFQIVNFTRSVDSVPIFFGTMALWNAWNAAKSTPTWQVNQTFTWVFIHSVLTRNGTSGLALTYPPLVLLYTSFGILGLVPLVAKYHANKRFDVYLNAIILASSAELSQNLLSFDGILQSNIFTDFFAMVLFFSLILIAMTAVSPAATKPKEIPLESYVTVMMTLVVSLAMLSRSIPLSTKVISPVLASSGLIILGAIAIEKRKKKIVQAPNQQKKREEKRSARPRHK
jgi:hypothetical protein